jgi:hypothetical protein
LLLIISFERLNLYGGWLTQKINIFDEKVNLVEKGSRIQGF